MRRFQMLRSRLASLWQTGRGPSARACDAIARRPDNADAHYMLGTVLRQQGDSADALTEFRATIKYRPTSAEAHLSLGQMLTQLGQKNEAEAAFAEAARLNQRKADAQASTFAVAAGMAKIKDADLQGAIATLRDAIRLAPDNPQAHYQLALALQRSGARADAAAHFAEAQKLAPYLRPPAGVAHR